MLRLLPHSKVSVIERCSGHGGSWGVMKENFEVGRPSVRQALKNATPFVSSECPLAAMHIAQGMEIEAGGQTLPYPVMHPIELFARACGIPGAWVDENPRTC